MRKLKTLPHHSDHGITLAIQRKRLIDHAAITREAPLPESVTQHRHAFLIARKHATGSSLRLQHRKEARRNVSSAHALRLRFGGYVETVIRISRNRVKDFRLLR